MGVHDFSKMSSFQLDQVSRDRSLVMIPIGSVQDYGPHLRLTHNIGGAHALCQKIGDEISRQSNFWPHPWDSVIFMPVPIGTQTATTKYAVNIRPQVLRDYLVDLVKSLAREGFKNFLCVSGQPSPRQLTAIEDAGKILARPFGGVFRKPSKLLLSANSALIEWSDVKKSPFFYRPKEHGGALDTSVAMATDQLIDNSFKDLVPVEGPHPSGYWGNPSKASIEQGRSTIEQQSRQIIGALKLILIDGEPPKSHFRSWYSILPPNKSTFKTWVTACLAMLVFVIWIAWLF